MWGKCDAHWMKGFCRGWCHRCDTERPSHGEEDEERKVAPYSIGLALALVIVLALALACAISLALGLGISGTVKRCDHVGTAVQL